MKTWTRALWHRRGQRPRPVMVVKLLPKKVRVADLVESTHRNVKLRDLMPSSLTEKNIEGNGNGKS